MASVQQTPQGPVLVLKESALQQKGRDAQKNNITAAKLVAELVKNKSRTTWFRQNVSRFTRGCYNYK